VQNKDKQHNKTQQFSQENYIGYFQATVLSFTDSFSNFMLIKKTEVPSSYITLTKTYKPVACDTVLDIFLLM